MKPSPAELAILRSEHERCATCVFWLQEPDNIYEGVCRRYPPKPQGYFRRFSPNHLTGAFQWCGEWRDASTKKPSCVFEED